MTRRDVECTRILINLRRAVTGPGRIYAADFVVSDPAEPHFAKLFDIHMMCWGTGRERAEFVELFAITVWRRTATYQSLASFINVVAGAAALPARYATARSFDQTIPRAYEAQRVSL
jgi:hypothetical protein